MESADHEVLRAAVAWQAQGHGLTLATVAATWGSSPRPPGSLMVVRADGRVAGSVSGGCVEADLIDLVRTREDPPRLPEVLMYGITHDQVHRFGLPCGGRLELVLEANPDPLSLQTLLAHLDERRLLTRRVNIQTGDVSLEPAQGSGQFSYDGKILTKTFGPMWRLLIIGAGQLSRYLAQMALALDYQIIICDPREEYASAWQVAGTQLDTRMPDDLVLALALDERSAVVALTHDPKLDDMALLEALNSNAFYVGALGSQANNSKRRARLATFGLTDKALARLHGPVGLPIGSHTPAEIAVAILAELTAERHGIQLQVRTGSPARAQGKSQPVMA